MKRFHKIVTVNLPIHVFSKILSLETLHLDIYFGGALEFNGMVNSVLLHCNVGDDFFNHKVFGCHFFWTPHGDAQMHKR